MFFDNTILVPLIAFSGPQIYCNVTLVSGFCVMNDDFVYTK